MNDTSTDRAPEAPQGSMHELIRLLGQVLSNAYLYGMAHKVTKASVQDAYDHLASLFETHDRINVTTADKDILIDGDVIPQTNPLVQTFARKILALKISGFSFSKGMEREEFDKLIEIINSVEEGGQFADKLAESGVSHVAAERVTYQRVTDGDVVVKQSDVDATGSGGAGDGRGADGAADGEGGAADGAAETGGDEGPPKIVVESILAFLKGETSALPADMTDEIKEIASDAERLAQMIMDATAVRQQVGDIESGEQFSSLVVGCLRRTYDALSAHPSSKTQKGKKELKKTLVMLEKSVLEKMRAMAQQSKDLPSMEYDLHEAVEEMKEEIEIEGLAAEYMKKRVAIDASERKILKYIHRKGADNIDESELKEKLLESGLSPDGWTQLKIMSAERETSAPADAGSGGGGAFGLSAAEGDASMISVLLAQLLERFDPSLHDIDKDAAATEDVMEKVDGEVSRIVQHAENKIDELAVAIKRSQDEDGVDDPSSAKEKQLSRNEILTILAEIVQELRQPLSVINCSISMMLEQRMGEINESQDRIMNLAASSGHRLAALINKLLGISGLPKTTSPDRTITSIANE